MNELLSPFFWIIVLIFSVIIHEISHGLVAYSMGDDTAKRAGRLTLNPLKHLDPIGSFAVPLVMYIITSGAFMFGWARPVPYDPRFLKNPKMAEGIIAAAGPASNIAIAVIFAGIMKGLDIIGVPLPPEFAAFGGIIIFINVLLGIFNAVPIPPLDGSKILFSLLPSSVHHIREAMERYGLFLLILFIFFGFPLIIPLIYGIFGLLT